MADMTKAQAATAIGWLLNGPVKVHTFLEDAFGYKVACEIMEGLKTATFALAPHVVVAVKAEIGGNCPQSGNPEVDDD